MSSPELPQSRLTEKQLARSEALQHARDACSSYKEAERDGGSGFAVSVHADAHHLMLVAEWILGEPGGQDERAVTPEPELFTMPPHRGKHVAAGTHVINDLGLGRVA